MRVKLRLMAGVKQMCISLSRSLKKETRGFTLVELLAVMAIIGILSGMVAGAVTGLGTSGINAQIVSDTKVMETAADRFLNDSFPAVYPVVPLAEGEEDLGVRAIDFDARLPQDPSKTFTPDFLKDIPDSAALVSYRIVIASGRVFPADDAADFAPPANTRLDIILSDQTPSGNPEVSFRLRMPGRRAALETLQMLIPAGVAIGGQSLAPGTVVGSLEITFDVDNPWKSGHEVSVDADVVATGRAHEWEISTDYTSATSDADGSPVTGVQQDASTLIHTITIQTASSEVPGTLTLEINRTGLTKAHNEASETWDLKIFATAEGSGETLITNPPVTAVYRWFTEAHSTILVEDIFRQVPGKQSVIIKGE
jgi:prepilin-type N-terminal cleavage/methylation domain-containing protein